MVNPTAGAGAPPLLKDVNGTPGPGITPTPGHQDTTAGLTAPSHVTTGAPPPTAPPTGYPPQQQQQQAMGGATSATPSVPPTSGGTIGYPAPNTYGSTVTAPSGGVSATPGQPKRLHVSNIPFRFREPDLRNLFYVSIPGNIV